MCGIAGIFQYTNQEKINHDELCRINNHMQSRGPDGAGLWLNTDEFIGLSHRRLSIIDLSDHAKQPMHDNGLSITFNGEIYNYKKLRDQLVKKNIQFKTHSDTEVILKLYQLYGVDMLDQLRGMFAFAIWDEKNKTLFCVRDQFGIKPFYFSDNGNTFRFASQVKALLAGSSSQINTKKSAAGHVGFFLLGSVPEPYTLYQGIQSLPAGSYLIINSSKKIHKEYYSVKSVFIHAENNSVNSNISLVDSLYDTVQHHLVADVDVGIFLSAGIDSSTLVSVASEIRSTSPKTMTLGFEEYKKTDKDEVPLAEHIAEIFKTHHQATWISEEKAQLCYEDIMAAMDQPSIDGINIYFVSQMAAEQNLKVALSGLGADELFSGYPHFSRIPKLTKYGKYFLVFGKLLRNSAKNIVSAKKASLLEFGKNTTTAYFLARALYMPWELENFFDKNFVNTGLNELNLFERLKKDISGIQSIRFQISALELQWYMRNQLLRDSDWAGMAHSLEIRVPFVDVKFFEAVVQLSVNNRLTKKDLAIAPHRKLPEVLLNKKKTGFNIPISKWFAHSGDMKMLSKSIYKKFI